MLDGTDLNEAYTSIDFNIPQSQQIESPKKHLTKSTPLQRNISNNVATPINAKRIVENGNNDSSNRDLAIPIVREHLTNEPSKFQNTIKPFAYNPVATTYPNPSYIDMLITKRKDTMKLITFAFVILLAISIHFLVDFSIKEIIMSNELNFRQELGIRLMYPTVIILLLWNFKALGSVPKIAS